MSDTCRLRLVFPRRDLPQFNEILKEHIKVNGIFWDMDEGDDVLARVLIEHAKDGWYYELLDLADAKLTFLANAGSCDAVDPTIYACFEGSLEYCRVENVLHPVIEVFFNGYDQSFYDECCKYGQILEMVNTRFNDLTQEEQSGGIK